MKFQHTKGRHGGIARDNRLYKCCSYSDIEDEYHFILVCPCYLEIRQKLIRKFYFYKPNVFQLVELLRINNVIFNYLIILHLLCSNTLKENIVSLIYPLVFNFFLSKKFHALDDLDQMNRHAMDFILSPTQTVIIVYMYIFNKHICSFIKFIISLLTFQFLFWLGSSVDYP